MEELAPWMHQFRFSDDALVGYYKFSGLGWDMTWCNRNSDPDRISRLVAAYEAISHGAFKRCLFQLFDKLDLPDRKSAAVIDLSSATGKNSFIAADYGFGRIISSEIRQASSEQQKLIVHCTDHDAYLGNIEPLHDPISADAPNFAERYLDCRPDLVMSIGLLYHLADPVQHLINLRRITQRYVLLHTMTHDIKGAEDAWRLLLERSEVYTKATSGISWTPHFFGLTNLIKKVGFRRCEIFCAEPYASNHPKYALGHVPDGGRIRDQLLARFGFRTAAARERDRYLGNFNPNLYEKLDVMPGNFFYLLER